MHLATGQNALDLIPFLAAVVVMPLVSIYNGSRIARAPDAPLIPRYAQTLARGVAVTLLLLGLWKYKGRPFDALGLDWPVSEIGLILLALVGLATVVLGAQIVFFSRVAKPSRLAAFRAQIREIKILPRTTNELLVFLLVAGMAGVWEELLYRGFLLWFLEPYLTIWGAVALSTAVFALGHIYQGWKGIPRAGGIGLLFAIGYVFSASLWWLIALHALVDLFGGLAAWRVMRTPPPA